MAAALAACSIAGAPMCAKASPDVITQNIVGGEELDDETAAPTAMLGSCSATLLTPSLLVTAAHCLKDAPVEAHFGRALEPVSVERCQAHPEYGVTPGHDIAYCWLASSLPYAPAHVISHCEAERLQEGTETLLVGYGYSDRMQRGARAPRMVSVRVSELRAEGRELVVGSAERGACHGDSGGSAFSVRDHDGLGLLGVISRRGPSLQGSLAPNCGGTTIVTAVAPHLEWLQRASGSVLQASCSVEDAAPVPTAQGCALARRASDDSVTVMLCVLLLQVWRQRRARARRHFSS